MSFQDHLAAKELERMTAKTSFICLAAPKEIISSSLAGDTFPYAEDLAQESNAEVAEAPVIAVIVEIDCGVIIKAQGRGSGYIVQVQKEQT